MVGARVVVVVGRLRLCWGPQNMLFVPSGLFGFGPPGSTFRATPAQQAAAAESVTDASN